MFTTSQLQDLGLLSNLSMDCDILAVTLFHQLTRAAYINVQQTCLCKSLGHHN